MYIIICGLDFNFSAAGARHLLARDAAKQRTQQNSRTRNKLTDMKKLIKKNISKSNKAILKYKNMIRKHSTF